MNTREIKENQENPHFFRMAVEKSSDAIGMSTPEGRHFYQNEAFTKLFGLSVEGVDGKSGPSSTIYADEKVGREVFATIMSGNTWHGEVEMFDKNKNKITVFLRAFSVKDETGKIISLVGIHTDITERKQEEMRLNSLVKDLQQFKETTIDRENKMIELKKEINKLSKELGKPEPYDLSFLNE